METARISEFVEAVVTKREADRLVKLANKRVDELMPEVVEVMMDEGVDNLTLNGYKITIARDIRASTLREDADSRWASPAERARVIAALREHGMEEGLVSETFNYNSLSARIRKMVLTNEPIPESLAATINVIDRFKAGVKKV